MIERVEMALAAWGDQYRRRGTVAALPCTLGAAMDAQGVMIRSTAPGNGYGVGLYGGPMGAVGEVANTIIQVVTM